METLAAVFSPQTEMATKELVGPYGGSGTGGEGSVCEREREREMDVVLWCKVALQSPAPDENSINHI